MMDVWKEERDARWADRVTEPDGCQSRACVRLLLSLDGSPTRLPRSHHTSAPAIVPTATQPGH